MDDGMGGRNSKVGHGEDEETKGEEGGEEGEVKEEVATEAVNEGDADNKEEEEEIEAHVEEKKDEEGSEREEQEEVEDKEEEIGGTEEGENEEEEKQDPNGDVKSHMSEETVQIEVDEGGERKNLYESSSCGRAIMDCGTCFSKYILCLFNFIVLLAGLGVLLLGVWLYADKETLLTALSKTLDEDSIPELRQYVEGDINNYIAYILMAIGGAMFLLSIIGYCGALKESRCLLGFYGFLLVIILILEVTAAGLAFVYKDRAESEIQTFLTDSILKYYDPATNNTQTMSMDLLMKEMQCCGVNDYTDFNRSVSFRNSGLKVPKACCILRDNGLDLLDSDCPKNPTETNSHFQKGCYQTLMNRIKEHMNIVIFVVIGLVCVELLSTFLAFCLCKSLEPYDK